MADQPRSSLNRLGWFGSLILVAGVVAVAPASANVSPAGHGQSQTGPNTWQATSPPAVTRSAATATLLPSGDVLVAGGATTKVELYDPTTHTFSLTGSLSTNRVDATATLLATGDVLVAGGRTGSKQLASAELYDPSTGVWSPTGSMTVARSGQTATLLPDGDVLVAGGGCNSGHNCDAGSFLGTLSSAELYHPASGSWTKAGHMTNGRQDGMAALLEDGHVLVAGGFTFCDDDFCNDTASANLYDPATNSWHATQKLPTQVEAASATVLEDGRVLVAGGTRLDPDTDRNIPLLNAELYDPSSGTWAPAASMPSIHVGQAAALLPNGWVLVASGQTASSQVYQPSKNIWVSTGGTGATRKLQTMTELANGDVLLTGGGVDSAVQFQYGDGPLVTLTPPSVTFPAVQVGAQSGPRTVTVTNNGTADLHATGIKISGAAARDLSATSTCIGVVVAPGETCNVQVLFAPTNTGARTANVTLVDDSPSPQQIAVSGFGNGPNTWASTGPMRTERVGGVSVLLRGGDALIAGGYSNSQGQLSNSELYNPATRRFTQTGQLMLAVADVSGTRLRNGDVLVAGGQTLSIAPTATAELYDPSTGVWSFTGSMLQPGESLTQTMLSDGRVLVTGYSGNNAEIYDPSAGTWKATSPMVAAAQLSTADLLSNGQVLVAGGFDSGTEAQLYNPSDDVWSATGPLNVSRQGPESVVLADGEVLVAGGFSTSGSSTATSELYDPSTGHFTLTTYPMSTGRAGFTLSALDGVVVAAGGCTGECFNGSIVASTELYLPQYQEWIPGPAMTSVRQDATATVLANGQLLVAGGRNGSFTITSSAETYTLPLLKESPQQGPVGTQVTLHGYGCYAFEKVRITFDFAPLATVETNKDGSFTATVTIPSGSIGAHTIRATGRKSFAQSSVVFEITG